MADARAILIAAPELIPALRERLGAGDELLTFADSDPLRAMQAICSERPTVVALERLFAASPRGAGLIKRIKADPSLDDCEILVLAHDGDYRRVSPRRRKPPSGGVRAHVARPLDRGTRRAVRVRMGPGVSATVDGEKAHVVDLSILGAQVLTAGGLRPGDSVQLVIGAAETPIEAAAMVIWARREVTGRSPVFRAGLEFQDAAPGPLTAFIKQHGLG